jgi:hypothetical protein
MKRKVKVWTLDRELVRLRLLVMDQTLGLIEGGGTSPQETCEGIAGEDPDLWEKFGAERVLRLCQKVQRSEPVEESARMQQEFDILNQKFFAAALPRYAIRYVCDPSYWGGEGPRLSRSSLDSSRQVITIGYSSKSDNISELLCHMVLIAHPGSNYFDAVFLKEIQRLRDRGAPVDLTYIRSTAGKQLVH